MDHRIEIVIFGLLMIGVLFVALYLPAHGGLMPGMHPIATCDTAVDTTENWKAWNIPTEIAQSWYDSEAQEKPFFESEEWQWLSGEIAFQFYLDIFAPIFGVPEKDHIIDSAKFYFSTEYDSRFDSSIPVYRLTNGDSAWLKYWIKEGGRWIVETDSGWIDTENGKMIWGW
jgi:hypothetical protein